MSSSTLACFTLLGCILAAGAAGAAGAAAAQPGVRIEGAQVIMSLPGVLPLAAGDPVDYLHAQPHALPIAANFSQEIAQADLIGVLATSGAGRGNASGQVQGNTGDGALSPQVLGTPATPRASALSGGGMTTQEFGSATSSGTRRGIAQHGGRRHQLGIDQYRPEAAGCGAIPQQQHRQSRDRHLQLQRCGLR